MSIRRRKGLGTIAMLLAFAITQVSLHLGMAAPNSSSNPVVLPQQLIARLTSTGSRQVSVNGIAVASGDSVATNAVIEVPPGTEATLDIGPLGRFDLAPGTKIQLEYDESCIQIPDNAPIIDDPANKKCKVKMTVLSGCVSGGGGKRGSRTEIYTEKQGKVADSEEDRKRKGGGAPFLNICVGPNGELIAPTSATAGGGFPQGVLIPLIIGGGTGGILCAIYCGGGNPSPSTPGS